MRKVLFAALALAAVSPAAYAADLGGNCCADLEDRIAELEAIAAKKGTRKVSLTISGQVNKAIASTSDEQYVIDNTSDESRVTFSGEGRISPSASAGFVLELHTNYEGRFPDPTASGSISTRRSAVWVNIDRVRVTAGLFDTATHELIDMTAANTSAAIKPINVLGLSATSGIADLVRADITLIDGVVVSASWAPSYVGGEDLFSIAVRGVTRGGGFKLLGGVGYDSLDGQDLISGSASVLHEATGLFLTGAAVKPSDADTAWHVTAGLERKLVEYGATTFYGEFGDWKDFGTGIIGTDEVWGLGVVQAIDAAATDLYVSYRNYDDEDIFLAGARVKF